MLTRAVLKALYTVVNVKCLSSRKDLLTTFQGIHVHMSVCVYVMHTQVHMCIRNEIYVASVSDFKVIMIW